VRANRRAAAGLVGCALLLSAAARADDDAAATPVRWVDNLQSAQAQIAQGDAAALAAQPRLLKQIAQAFAAAKPEVWRTPRNARAAVIFLLSGGPPRVVMRLLNNGEFAKPDEDLVRGALAYEIGRTAEAQRLLGAIDPNGLELTLGAQVAFVQSMLLTSIDSKKAIALLDLARLLSPGGLVEEASLRREVALLGDVAPDGEKFMALARQYMARFPKSPYADNLLKTFAAVLPRLQIAEDAANFPKFESMTATLDSDARRTLFLAIARTALTSGKIAMAYVAADHALSLAAADSSDASRARLYRAAARSLTDQYEAGIAELKAIDARKLPKRDAPLLAAARAVAARVRAPTPPPPAVAPGAPNDNDPADATIRLAETALANAKDPTEAAPP
jgi:chemotaxis protein MotC